MQKSKHNFFGFRREKKLFFIFTLFLIVLVPRPAYADVWGASIAAANMKEMMEIVRSNIQGVLLANLKVLAVKVMNNQLEQLIGGQGGNGPLYISNWQQYLYQIPGQQNQIFLNDLLSQTTRGKCSGLNFQSVATGTFGSNYFTYLCNQAQSSALGGIPRVNIDEYAADPIRSLSEGDWRVFNALFANPANNPLGYSLLIQNAQQRDLAARVEAAKAEGIANQGYKSVKQNGQIVTPGRTVGDIVANVKTAGNNLILSAQNPAEFLGSLVSSIANRAINQMLQRGFDSARTTIQRELGKVNQQLYQTNQQVNQVLGPGGQFLQSVNQQIGPLNQQVRYNQQQNPATCNNGDCP